MHEMLGVRRGNVVHRMGGSSLGALSRVWCGSWFVWEEDTQEDGKARGRT